MCENYIHFTGSSCHLYFRIITKEFTVSPFQIRKSCCKKHVFWWGGLWLLHGDIYKGSMRLYSPHYANADIPSELPRMRPSVFHRHSFPQKFLHTPQMWHHIEWLTHVHRQYYLSSSTIWIRPASFYVDSGFNKHENHFTCLNMNVKEFKHSQKVFKRIMSIQ